MAPPIQANEARPPANAAQENPVFNSREIEGSITGVSCTRAFGACSSAKLKLGAGSSALIDALCSTSTCSASFKFAASSIEAMSRRGGRLPNASKEARSLRLNCMDCLQTYAESGKLEPELQCLCQGGESRSRER